MVAVLVAASVALAAAGMGQFPPTVPPIQSPSSPVASTMIFDFSIFITIFTNSWRGCRGGGGRLREPDSLGPS